MPCSYTTPTCIVDYGCGLGKAARISARGDQLSMYCTHSNPELDGNHHCYEIQLSSPNFIVFMHACRNWWFASLEKHRARARLAKKIMFLDNHGTSNATLSTENSCSQEVCGSQEGQQWPDRNSYKREKDRYKWSTVYMVYLPHKLQRQAPVNWEGAYNGMC